MHDLDRVQAEFEAPDEYFEIDGSEPEFDPPAESEGAFDEGEELELAAELLDVGSDSELDQFLGSWLKKFGKKASGFLSTGAGRALGGVLKGTIKQVLPGIAGAAGNLLVPGLGGVLGSKAASMAGSMLGLELEGLSPEDQEFEAARQLVRLGSAAMAQAARAPSDAPAQDVAMRALSSAASHYAPGLLRQGGSARAQHGARRTHGTWRRVGNRIILEGL